MPRVKAELATGIEPEEGKTYMITAVEETKTAVQGFSAYRVALEPTKRKESDENQYAAMLWSREQAGVSSKLGSFLSAFLEHYGDEDMAWDTDNWVGCAIRFVSWIARKREVEVIEGKKK